MTPSPAEADATAPTANQNGLVAAATADAAVPATRGRRPGGRGVVAAPGRVDQEADHDPSIVEAADHDPDPTHVSQTFAALGRVPRPLGARHRIVAAGVLNPPGLTVRAQR